MHEALDVLARALTGGPADTRTSDTRTSDWAAMRYQHTAALRALLSDRQSPVTGQRYAPATLNRTLAGLRGASQARRRLCRIAPLS